MEERAHFFVCGDAKRMVKDVDATLHEIVIQHGGKDREQASEYVEQLKKDKRYERDRLLSGTVAYICDSVVPWKS